MLERRYSSTSIHADRGRPVGPALPQVRTRLVVERLTGEALRDPVAPGRSGSSSAKKLRARVWNAGSRGDHT
jgi:hypothetical protein